MKLKKLTSHFVLLAAALFLSSTSLFAQSTGGFLIEGSFELDRAASENTSQILETVSDRERANASERSDLAGKIEAPENISITIEGDRITLSTSRGDKPAVFTADGVARTSTDSSGKRVSLLAELRGQVLRVSSLGGESDYTVTFTPLDNGRSMRVTRRITTSYLSQTIFVDSVYRKTDRWNSTASNTDNDDGWSDSGGNVVYDPTPRDDRDDDSYGDRRDDYPASDEDDGWSDSGGNVVYDPPAGNDRNNRNPRPDYRRSPRTGKFAVSPGTVLTGSLESFVTTKASQDGDPFRMRVESPVEFRGAVIEGYVSDIERTGKVTGRSKITFNFESIVLADGRRYDFAGVLERITDEEGDEIGLNDEGEARTGSRTKETVKRSGIGAGIGAVLGAILGGGKGAVIGATIGAGAGAGSMIPGGRKDLEIGPDDTLSVRSTGPGN